MWNFRQKSNISDHFDLIFRQIIYLKLLFYYNKSKKTLSHSSFDEIETKGIINNIFECKGYLYIVTKFINDWTVFQ